MRTVTDRGGRVAVFCGARPGANAGYLSLATDFGRSLAGRGFGLVYGGGGIGVMGAVADAVLAGGGDVVGVVPWHLRERERSDRAQGRVFVVRSMHERKALMYRLSSGFAVLPGGIGTMDELMEVLTWNKLGIIDKPVVVVNYRGFFDLMLAMLDHFVTEGFLAERDRNVIRVASDPEDAFDMLGLVSTPPHAPTATGLPRTDSSRLVAANAGVGG